MDNKSVNSSIQCSVTTCAYNSNDKKCCTLPSIILLILFLSASVYCAYNLLSFR